ncbi:hypothetical protein ACKFRJ_07380 [Corynebacterium kefirresidentii]|uniref:hypothetical protein n=1 Tax=Corynebacterium kefirresidentii TaxID=1979527 RepID=UPI0038CF7022
MHKVFDDDGSVTIEAALALSSLVLVAAGIVGAIATLASYIAAVDMAGAAARAHAIGVEYHPAREDAGRNAGARKAMPPSLRPASLSPS